MDLAFNIIVIILSAVLLVFLGLGIAIGVLVYKLVKTLRAVAEKGGHLVDTAEEIGSTFKRNAGAAGLLKMLVKFIAMVSKARKGK